MQEKDKNLARRNAFEVFRDAFNIAQVKKVFRLGSEVFGAVQPFINNQTPLAAVQSVFAVGEVLVNTFETWPDGWFDEEWETSYGKEFNVIIHRALQHKPYKLVKTSDKVNEIRLFDLTDEESGKTIRVGCIFDLSTGCIDTFYTPVREVELVKKIMKKEMWKTLKHDNIVLRYLKHPTKEGSIVLEPDIAFQPLPSKRAEEYSAYIKRCIEAGIPRSVMLYGPPGTGKSTMARTIIDKLNMRSFRIRVEDIGNVETSTVFEAINIFEPDAVIFDDFDRVSTQAVLLETLEYFHKNVKLTIATVNNRNNLDEGILRPGRFDEMIHVKSLDEDVVKSVLGEYNDALETVKDWPVAFVHEYVKRRRFMTAQEAEKSTAELAQRVARLEVYEDPVDKMIQSVQEKISPKKYEKLDNFYKKNYKKFFDRKTKRKFLEAERTLTVALLGRAKKPVLKRVKKNSRS